MQLTVQNYRSAEMPLLAAFIEAYRQTYPDARLFGPDFYTYNPAFKNGENVFCVLAPDSRMIGFAPLAPALPEAGAPPVDVPDFWAVILALPGNEQAEAARSLLYEAICRRTEHLAREHNLFRLRLAADMMAS